MRWTALLYLCGAGAALRSSSLSGLIPQVKLRRLLKQDVCVSTDECCTYLYPDWKKSIASQTCSGQSDAQTCTAPEVQSIDLSLQSIHVKKSSSGPNVAIFSCADMRINRGWTGLDIQSSADYNGYWSLQCSPGFTLQRYMTYLESAELRAQGKKPWYLVVKGECLPDGQLPDRSMGKIPN